MIHPGPTLGYRLTSNRRSVAYLSDHEPALGSSIDRERWTSGFDLADSVDVLLHDGQYTADEYRDRVGWGHSSVEHAAALADLARADRLAVPPRSGSPGRRHRRDARAHEDESRRGTADAASEGLTIEL